LHSFQGTKRNRREGSVEDSIYGLAKEDIGVLHKGIGIVKSNRPEG